MFKIGLTNHGNGLRKLEQLSFTFYYDVTSKTPINLDIPMK